MKRNFIGQNSPTHHSEQKRDNDYKYLGTNEVNENGAFKIYTKKSSLKKLADFLEDIVIDIAKKY